MALNLKRIPFLEDGQRRKNQSKIARDAMTKQTSTDGIVCFNEVETNVTDVLAKLAGNSHNGFPVRHAPRANLFPSRSFNHPKLISPCIS